MPTMKHHTTARRNPVMSKREEALSVLRTLIRRTDPIYVEIVRVGSAQSMNSTIALHVFRGVGKNQQHYRIAGYVANALGYRVLIGNGGAPAFSSSSLGDNELENIGHALWGNTRALLDNKRML